MLIVTRPQHDLTTKYISLWAKEIIDLAKRKSIQYIDLEKTKANKKEFIGRMKKLAPRLVFLNGHGNEDFVTGHNDEILIQKDINHDILKGKIVYALSCKSGKNLGRKIAEYKNSVYIGYIEDYVFLMDNEYTFKPLEDPLAKLFKESSNQIMISLLKGNTISKALERSKDSAIKNYKRLLLSNADTNSLNIAKYLWWNQRNQMCFGDTEITYNN